MSIPIGEINTEKFPTVFIDGYCGHVVSATSIVASKDKVCCVIGIGAQLELYPQDRVFLTEHEAWESRACRLVRYSTESSRLAHEAMIKANTTRDKAVTT